MCSGTKPIFGGSLLDASQTLTDARLADGSSVDAVVPDFCAAISTGDSAVQNLFDSDAEVEPVPVAIWNVHGSNSMWPRGTT